jgi:hypothetical protein
MARNLTSTEQQRNINRITSVQTRVLLFIYTLIIPLKAVLNTAHKKEYQIITYLKTIKTNLFINILKHLKK